MLFSYLWIISALTCYGLPWWLRLQRMHLQGRDPGLIPGLGRSPGEGNGNSPQYSRLGNPMDTGAWRATIHGVTEELDIT